MPTSKMPRGRKPTDRTRPSDLPDIVLFWIMRILLRLGGQRRFLREMGYYSDELADALGLPPEDPEQTFDRPTALKQLKGLGATFPTRDRGIGLPGHLKSNIDRLAALLGMSEIEQSVLAFSVLLQSERALGEAADLLGELPTSRTYRVLSQLLDIPEADIRVALGPRGVLHRTGLVVVDKSGSASLQGKLDVLSQGFADRMVSLDADPFSLLRDKVHPAQPPTLQRSDFAHLEDYLRIAHAHLERTLADCRPGTNVFIHGLPGVGKTELVRLMAKELGVELYEISSEDEDGDPMDGDRRLRAYRAAQWFFADRRVMFLFDEVEDVFSGGDGVFAARSSAARRKAWMNRTLESNPTPTFWVSNQVDCLDPAFVRRFDIVLELPVPPQKQREKIIREATGTWLDEPRIKRLAAVPHLAPAIAARASVVASALAEGSDGGRAATATELLIDSTLKAQGLESIPRPPSDGLPEFYDPAFINAGLDLSDLAGQLIRNPSVRICLSGPPGTGKTAYARWLANQLGKPLLTRRASDLLSMWVGESEKAIAEVFAQAERDDAALLIDEVDSFLQDRRNARHSWEISMVNEMLTQMEIFPGLFLASTNLMDSLDPATLRRFDLKLRFDLLKPAQAWEMAQRLAKSLVLPVLEPALRIRMERMRQLTPGDFAVVARRHRIRPITSGPGLLDELEVECSHKTTAPGRFGFV